VQIVVSLAGLYSNSQRMAFLETVNVVLLNPREEINPS